MHLDAAQSFATRGWGPEEYLRKPDSDGLYTALTMTHRGFETPCGSYAHLKLTRYLLRITRDGHYGNSIRPKLRVNGACVTPRGHGAGHGRPT